MVYIKQKIEILTILLLCFLINSELSGQTQINLEGSFDSKAEVLNLKFMYAINSTVKLNSFMLYKREGGLKNTSENLSDFKLVGELKDYNDSVDDKSNKVFCEWSGKHNLESDVETLVVVTTALGMKIISNPIEIKSEQKHNHSISFISQNNETNIFLNQDVKYQAEAKSTSNTEIEYSLIESSSNGEFKTDANAKIESKSGLFTWTPIESGKYKFTILAKTTVESEVISAQQYLYFVVDECEGPSYLEVTLVDENGKTINSAKISAISIDNNNTKDRIFESRTNAEGKANIQVTKGNYILSYDAGLMNSTYFYGGGLNKEDATKISVNCNNTYSINFEINRSDSDTIDLNGLVFVKYPESEDLKISPNEEFQFDFKAEYSLNINSEIEYELISKHQDKGECNSETGKFKFSSETEGRFAYTIRAKLKSINKVFTDYNFIMNVTDCEEQASLTLDITDEDGNKLNKGIVNLFEYHSDDNENVSFVEKKIRYTIDLKQNNRTLNVEGGSYLMLVKSNNKNYWFENAKDIKNANSIEIACGEEKKISMSVGESEVNVEHTKVSGYCLNADGTVASSVVVFEGINSNNLIGLNEKIVTEVSTDANGYYSAELPKNYIYTAFAINAKTQTSLYWENQKNPINAKKIIADTEVIENINFVFEEENNSSNYIKVSGSVMTKSNVKLTDCFVVCMPVESNNGAINSNGETFFAQNGNFEFDLKAGSYVFLAIPTSNNYLPTYYNQNGEIAIAWEQATIVNVTSNFNSTVEIVLNQIERKPGSARVNGNIKAEVSSSNIDNASIVLISANTLVEYSASNYYGEFDISNVADGEYKLVVSKVGYQKFETNLKLDDENPINLDINLKESSQPLSVNVSNNIITKVEAFPNPSSDYIDLNFNKLISSVKYEIFTMNGNIALSGEYNTGKKINVSSLTNGKYIFRLYNNGDCYISFFTVNR